MTPGTEGVVLGASLPDPLHRLLVAASDRVESIRDLKTERGKMLVLMTRFSCLPFEA